MATINEIPRMIRWVKTVLAADPTLYAAVGGRIYEGHVPEGKAYPAVVFSITPGRDISGNGAPAKTRVWAKAEVLVKGINETNDVSSLQTIADRIDDVMEYAIGGVADIAIDQSKRIGTFYMKDTSVLNKVYMHLGARFEIAARYVA